MGIENMAEGIPSPEITKGASSEIASTGPQTGKGEVKSSIPGMPPEVFDTLRLHYPDDIIESQRKKYGNDEAFLAAAAAQAERLRTKASQQSTENSGESDQPTAGLPHLPLKPGQEVQGRTVEEAVLLNAQLNDEARKKAAGELLYGKGKKLSEQQQKELIAAHEKTSKEEGLAKGYRAGVYNLTPEQVRQKARELPSFTPAERRKLFEAGLVGEAEESKLSKTSKIEEIKTELKKIMRSLRGITDESARNAKITELRQKEQERDVLMTEARDNGMLIGLDLELDDVYRKIISHHHPANQREELEGAKARFKEKFSDLKDRFEDEYSDDEVSKYAGVQQIYLEKGLEAIERSINNREGGKTPIREWEWTVEEFRLRALEDELAARRNKEVHQKEEKKQDRTATLEEFILLKNLVDSKDAIERYIYAKYRTDIDIYSGADRDNILRTDQATIQNTPPRLRQIGDEAWKNFKMVADLRKYAEAKENLEKIITKTIGEEEAKSFQEAQRSISDTSAEQKRVADEILQRGDKIPSTQEGFIETILNKEKQRLFQLATKAIIQEEKIGKDSRNYLQLHEAYEHAEKIMKEAVTEKVLVGLRNQMFRLYAEKYRKKIWEGSIQPGDRTDLEALRDKAMAEEKSWWDNNMRDRGFTEQFRERFEGVRAFYIYRAFQRIEKLIDSGENITTLTKRQEFQDKLLSEKDIFEEKEQELLLALNQRKDELQQLVNDGKITPEQFDEQCKFLEIDKLKQLGEFSEQRLVTGEWRPVDAEKDLDTFQKEEAKRKLEGNTFWTRTWGTVHLEGETRDQLLKGVNSFLEIACSNESNFDPQRYIEDGTRLGQEIQRVGENIGMDRKEIAELVARAEGTLFINVADYFAVRWNVNEWHQIASLVGRHFDTRMNAVTKAYGAEVMHASYLLDNDEGYETFARPARYVSEKCSSDDEAANSRRSEMRRKLEVRIALSKIKDIDTVIREHTDLIILGAATPPTTISKHLSEMDRVNKKLAALDKKRKDGDPIDQADELTAQEVVFAGNGLQPKDLFQHQVYLDEIDRIDKKLKALNLKLAKKQAVNAADRLTDEEKQLLILDKIRPYQKTEDLAVIGQTDAQFNNLYIEYGGLGKTKEEYDARVQDLLGKVKRGELISDKDKEALAEALEMGELLAKVEKGESLTDEDKRLHPDAYKKISEAKQAVDLAIKTRNVFFISADKACASLVTRRNTPEGQGELLSYNDVVRLNKFVRERAIISLPAGVVKIITGPRISSELNNPQDIINSYEDPDKVKKDYAALMYTDIADKLEFINLSERVITEKGKDSELGKNAQESLRLITLTKEEKLYADYVEAVEKVQEQVLEKLKEKGSNLTVTDIDGIIQSLTATSFATRQTARDQQVQSMHRGETQRKASFSYRDIINREDADPQYNFSMMDDQKYSSLLLSDEIRAAAYDPDHPYYNSTPAAIRRVLDPDGTKLVQTGNADVDRQNAFRVQETQRRFHFAVDSVKVFGAFYQPDLYKPESDKPTIDGFVINIRNSPFIGRRMIEQRTWTLWNRGQAARGRGFLKYLESNFRGLDHTVGRRGLRGVVESYNGNGLSQPKGFGFEVDFSGVMDELAAERWLEQAKSAEAVRPVLIGGQVGQDPNFEGIFKKIVKTIGINNPTRGQNETGLRSSSPALSLMAHKDWGKLEEGDFEKAIDAIEDRWKRVTIYGNSLGFVGTASQVPLAAKFSGDTAVRRMAYWAVAYPEGYSVYNVNMPLIRAILEPFTDKSLTPKQKNYFGPGGTLLGELMRRAVLAK